jgi:hypothetical protein
MDNILYIVIESIDYEKMKIKIDVKMNIFKIITITAYNML